MKKNKTAIYALVLFVLGAAGTSQANVTYTFESANGGTQTVVSTLGGTVNLGGTTASGNSFGGPNNFIYTEGVTGGIYYDMTVSVPLASTDYTQDSLTLSSGSFSDVFAFPQEVNEDLTANIPSATGADAFTIYIDGEAPSSSYIGVAVTQGSGAPTTFTHEAFSTIVDIPFSGFGAVGNSFTVITEGAASGFGNELTFAVIPEPSTVSLVGLCALAGVMVKRYRTRTNKKDVIPSEGIVEKW